MAWTGDKGYDGTTYFGEVDAGGGTVPCAIFLPDKFHTSPGIDLILYYHGHTTAYGATSVRELLDAERNQPIRAAVGQHGKYALVVPWLGKSSNATYIKAVSGSTDGFTTFMDSALGAIRGWTKLPPVEHPAAQDVRSVVLAGHSGGGYPLSATIGLKTPVLGKAISAWCLDCFYNIDIGNWRRWLKDDRSLYCYYTINKGGDSTDGNSVDLKGALRGGKDRNFEVAESPVGHHKIPGHYFPLLLEKVAPTVK